MLSEVSPVTRPEQLTCGECGAFLENAVDYSTCPYMHGKLHLKLDSETLKRIEWLRWAEIETPRINARPEAVEVYRHHSGRCRYAIAGEPEEFRLARMLISEHEVYTAWRKGRMVAKFAAAPSGFAVFRKATARSAKCQAK